LGETHEATKIDIQQLKEQIHEILEAIKTLENSGETSTQQHQQRVQETQVFIHTVFLRITLHPLDLTQRKKL